MTVKYVIYICTDIYSYISMCSFDHVIYTFLKHIDIYPRTHWFIFYSDVHVIHDINIANIPCPLYHRLDICMPFVMGS